MKKTWMPVVAGSLSIAAAGANLLAIMGLAIFGALAIVPQSMGVNASIIFYLVMIPLAAIAVLALVGGIYALQRKKWGIALTGAIAAFLPFSLLGIAAVILIALSKDEFE